MQYPLISLTCALILKWTTTSFIRRLSQTKRISGSFGTLASQACILTLSGMCGPGIGDSRNRAGPFVSSTEYLHRPLNVTNFLDISDPSIFPRAFVDAIIGSDYAPQHTSDLVRFPLLIKYGGGYADVGLMQIGDLDRLWNKTVGDPVKCLELINC